jgi:hypothetical protein
MRERAMLLGGSLRVERGVNGTGTCVTAWIPVASPGGDGEPGTSLASGMAPGLQHATALPVSPVPSSEGAGLAGDRTPT